MINKILYNLQCKLFEIGSTKNHFHYERIGNFIQDIRKMIKG